MIETEVIETVGILRINRPEARNALTPELQFSLIEKFDELAADPLVGAIVLTGAGEAFCAGGDVKSMRMPQTGTIDEQIADLRTREEIVRRIRGARQVVIGQINGPAAGAGLALALACDIRICSPAASFGAVYARVGLTGDFGISWLLQSEIGAAHARQMMLNAAVVDSKTALLYGIVHEEVAQDDLAERALILARKYSTGPRTAYDLIKQNLNEAARRGLDGTLDFEARHLVLAKQTRDHKEAIAAFAEKRKPAFRGD